MAVASAGPYANNLAPCSRQITNTSPVNFLLAGCSFWCPINSVKTLKAHSIRNVGIICRDIIPAGKDLAETNWNLDEITNYVLMLQSETGITPLWATCNLFSHPRCVVMFHFFLFVFWLASRVFVWVFSKFYCSLCGFTAASLVFLPVY